ncbi:MAG: hypothetical protein JXQ75_11410 [Phycisphaerae bacterium]|nr:hypothetical protein [Phycisphaerae bacterium]
MPEFDLGVVKVDLNEIRSAILALGRLRKRLCERVRLLDCVSRDDLLMSLSNGLSFLLKDRLEEGIGAGGWGHSDRMYMRDLYGPKVGQATRDSVMTTVAVVEALQVADRLLRQGTGDFARRRWPQIWDEIRSGVNAYTGQRWDSRTGAGGTLLLDREDTPRVAPSYRHTAWFLRLAKTECGYLNSARTAQYLIDSFDDVDWEREKAATPAAALSAFDLISRDEGLSALAEKARVTYLREAAQQALAKKYSAKLNGWTSGLDPEKGRQLYTLFVLTELEEALAASACPLATSMSRALEGTLRSPWRGRPGSGLPACSDGEPDISVSCLGISALISRHRVRELEEDKKRSFAEILSFLVEATGRTTEWPERTYAWTVSYFLKDVCRLLLED